jgi:PAS domain S-box-containing protein
MSPLSAEAWWLLLLGTITILILAAAFVASLISSNRRLKRERDFSTTIVDTNPALIIVLDRQGRIVRFNRSCETLSGYSMDEMLGHSFTELSLVPDKAFAGDEKVIVIQKEKVPKYFESEWVAKDGSKYSIAWSTVELQETVGQVKWIISGIDITERKRIEAELSESRMRLELALDGSEGGLWDIEFKPHYPPDSIPDNIYISPRLKGFIGYQDDELPNSLESWHQKILPEDLPMVKKKAKDHLRGNSELYEVQHRIRHKNGSIRWIFSRGRIKRNEQGSPVRWTGVDWDITLRKQAEEALLESEERLRTVMEKLPSGIVVLIDGGFEYANPAFCKLTGYSNEELHGKLVVDYLHPDDQEKARNRINDLMNDGEEFFSEYTLINRGGESIPIEVYSRKIFYYGKSALLSNVRDITERKIAEEAISKYHQQLQSLSSHLQSVREKERASIAREIHDELGQELSTALLHIGWLEEHAQGGEKSWKDKLKTTSDLIESTINKVQRISSELRPSLLDHLGLFAAIEWQAKEFTKKTDIPCKVHIGNKKIKLNQEISIAIFRIFQESLTNILRHAKATEVKVSLSEKSGGLFLEISDNGVGITEEQKYNPKSFGLLGIQERVRALQGEYGIEGIPQKGTSLSVSIPIETNMRVD